MQLGPFNFRIHDYDWWHWLATDLLEFGRSYLQTRDLWAFSTQVRWHYTLLLVAALWPPLHWIYWIQFLGTTRPWCCLTIVL